MSRRDQDPNWMTDSREELVADVVDQYLAQVENGENPSIESFADGHPEIGDLLREMLPAMKAVHRETTSWPPAPSPQEQTQETEIRGQLGDFRIIREIGRGGMGVVYEAEQISLRRRVALKVLPFAAALDPKRLERFQNESQAAARLHHANIVPVYSVGCERGVYYYAMQIIEGHSLAEVIRSLRRMKDPDEDDLPPQPGMLSFLSPAHSDHERTHEILDAGERIPNTRTVSQSGSDAPGTPTASTHTHLGVTTDTSSTATPGFIKAAVNLGIQAAEALEHAHSFDVVHRDIKPANLLVDSRGQLWITDFGLARVRTEASVTVSGDFVGTFLYSSPEQVLGLAGGVDARSDIYSLGATLYELLTQEPVVQSIRREKILHEIANSDPIAPRRHNNGIPADLETILLKSLSKEPAMRYQSARDFADDLRRFQDDRPILARRPTLMQRSSRWLRRHTSVIVSGVVVLVTAVVLLAVSLILIANAQKQTNDAYTVLYDEQNATRKALAAEEKQRRVAEQHFQQARDMLEVFLEVVDKDLADYPELQGVRAELLQLSLAYYQDFIEQSEGDAPLQSQLAQAHMGIARILNHIGSTPAALEAIEQALETQENLVRANPNDRRFRMQLFSMYQQLGVFRGRDELWLASLPSVKQELRFTAGQDETIESLMEKHRIQFQQIKKWTDFISMRKQFQEQTEEIEGTLRAQLTDLQASRLNQISLQRQGAQALLNPEVVEQLSITDEQAERIRAVQKEIQDYMRKWNTGDRPPEVGETLNSSTQRILAVLTDEQRAAWDSMKGEPFTGSFSKTQNEPDASSDSTPSNRN